jgi:2-polyprenyl-3-methyl-5-hydroxy-6-metoxy-1,4-benzoquinol methylase
MGYHQFMGKLVNQNSYNKIAQTWHEFRLKSKPNRAIVDLAKLIKPKGMILDVGCGSGFPNAHYLAKEGFKVTGIDIAESMIAIARSLNIANALFEVKDILSFSSTKRFDAIIAFDSLFHLEIQDQLKALTNIVIHLEPGGYFLMTHGKRQGETTGVMFGEPFYYSSLDAETFRTYLEKQGLKMMTSMEDYQETSTGTRDFLLIAQKR